MGWADSGEAACRIVQGPERPDSEPLDILESRRLPGTRRSPPAEVNVAGRGQPPGDKRPAKMNHPQAAEEMAGCVLPTWFAVACGAIQTVPADNAPPTVYKVMRKSHQWLSDSGCLPVFP